jgi:hypothetical protein
MSSPLIASKPIVTQEFLPSATQTSQQIRHPYPRPKPIPGPEAESKPGKPCVPGFKNPSSLTSRVSRVNPMVWSNQSSPMSVKMQFMVSNTPTVEMLRGTLLGKIGGSTGYLLLPVSIFSVTVLVTPIYVLKIKLL